MNTIHTKIRKGFLILGTILCPMAHASDPVGKEVSPTEGDAIAIQGEWKITAAETGAKNEADKLVGKTWVFTKGELDMEVAGDPKNKEKKYWMKFSYEIQPAMDPKRMVLSLKDEAGQAVVNQAIYKVHGHKLKVCLTFNSRAGVNQPFPEVFEVKKGDVFTSLFMLERVKK